jgi:hypothetical protein
MLTLTYPLDRNIAANEIPPSYLLLLEKIPTDLTKSHIAGGAILLLVIFCGKSKISLIFIKEDKLIL